MATIPLCIPCLGDEECRMVAETVASGWVSSVGPYVERFELAFAQAVGSPHAVACASGTAALHLALRACGVGPGDRVLVSDSTFIASVNPIMYQGAEPILIDSEERSWNLDPALVEQALAACASEGRPAKAVIAVHILGQPADLGPIAAACARHGAWLIEDAAEALGASYTDAYPDPALRGRQVGTIGRVGCFSFNGNKIITTGGGGMCVTADAQLAQRLKHLSTQAKLAGPAFVHDEVGYNYRLTNLAAALGLVQLTRLPAFLTRKAEIAARYQAVSVRNGWTYHPCLPGSRPSHWLTSCIVGEGRDGLMASLESQGIISRPLWQRLADQAPYRQARTFGGQVAGRLAAQGLSLPCSAGMTAGELDQVVSALSACHRA